MKINILKKVVVNIARVILAVTLIFSGFVKAVDPLGTQYKITDYLTVLELGKYVPDFVTLGTSILLSGFEFVLGVCLLFAIQRRLTSLLTLLTMAVMTVITLWLAVANPVSDCGCFGDAIVLTNWQTFGKNIVLLLLSVIVWRGALHMVRFISQASQWIVINYTMVFILVVSGWSLYDLPYFDFRPYHVGTNLRQGWQRTMDGADLPYADLFMERMDDGEDITEELLNNPGYVLLLVSPHLETADDSQLDLLNQMYEYAEDNGYPFYCLTASGEQAISNWRETTGAEYPFCQTDDIVLKTVIRSNPGLLLLKDGVIIRKWSHNRMPDEYALSDRLENLKIGKMPIDSIPQKILVIVLWYVLPLLVLTIADRLWSWTHWMRRRHKTKAKDEGETQITKDENENVNET